MANKKKKEKTGSFSTIATFLEGKKTYIGAAVIFIAGGMKATKNIDDQAYQMLFDTGMAISVLGLRAFLEKVFKNQ